MCIYLDNHLNGRKCCGQILRMWWTNCHGNKAGVQTAVERSDQINTCNEAVKIFISTEA